jgi:sarcosine oxidase subunit beta
VFEQAMPAVEPSASWASAGGVRQQGRDPREWALTVEAARRWPVLADELGTDCQFRAGGHLHVTETPEAVEALAARVRAERQAGIEVELVDGAAARSIAPLLSDRVVAATFTRCDGQANPRLTSAAFRLAAIRHGVDFCRQAVDGLAVEEPLVVLAAGAWTSGVARSAGIELPIQTVGLQMLRTDRCEPALAPTIASEERALSLKQLPDGAFYIGGGWPADVVGDPFSCQVRADSVRGSWLVASELVPVLAERRIAEKICGLEGQSFDGVPLIGPLAERSDVYLAAGFSGHGFQLAPAVGRAVADELLGKEVPELAGLRPSRTR